MCCKETLKPRVFHYTVPCKLSMFIPAAVNVRLTWCPSTVSSLSSHNRIHQRILRKTLILQTANVDSLSFEMKSRLRSSALMRVLEDRMGYC